MSLQVKAVTVCVDFHDYAAVTLPRNARFFDRVVVVTTPEDTKTQAIVATVPNAICHLTRAFYANNCHFNKGAAIEESFDTMGREGWFVHMDIDTILPDDFAWPSDLQIGKLYTPRRRMMENVAAPVVIPPSREWSRLFPLHPQCVEWAGYFQMANAADPVLRERPWYPTTWVHGGGSDSELQAKWHPSNKVRPAFEVLHLGESGVNWAGRASAYLDGQRPPEAATRISTLRQMIRSRTHGPGRFDGEKIKVSPRPP